jgi:uncharacterized LabA/DUF88 family protein
MWVEYFYNFFELRMSAFHKTALFIDGQNLHFTAKALGFDIDFKRLLAEFERRGTLVRAYYYTAIVDDAGYSTVRPLIDWLSYNGFTVVTRSTKEHNDGEGRRMFKRNIGVELSVDAIEIAKHIGQVVLFSGDGEFRPLVEAMQGRGCRVTVVSSLKTSVPMIADELRRQADEFLELDSLRAIIGRTLPSDAA